MSTRDNPSLPVPPRTDLSTYLVQQIIALIHGASLKPGDRLPSTKVLAERFSVATPTLREALRRLQAGGVVDIRHGSGVYVRNERERFVLANPHHAGLEADVILNLLDARLLIEPHLAELAAHHATKAEIVNMERHLDDAESYLADRDLELHEVNMRFHASIASASGNQVLCQIIESLIELYSSEQMAILWLYGARALDYEQHREIFAMIRDRMPDQARERMAEHLRDVRSVVESSLSTAGFPNMSDPDTALS